MSSEPESYNIPPWKFVAALVVMLVLVTLGTLFWMWRDARPRRRPAMLGAPEPSWFQTNAVPAPPARPTNTPP